MKGEAQLDAGTWQAVEEQFITTDDPLSKISALLGVSYAAAQRKSKDGNWEEKRRIHREDVYQKSNLLRVELEPLMLPEPLRELRDSDFPALHPEFLKEKLLGYQSNGLTLCDAVEQSLLDVIYADESRTVRRTLEPKDVAALASAANTILERKRILLRVPLPAAEKPPPRRSVKNLGRVRSSDDDEEEPAPDIET